MRRTPWAIAALALALACSKKPEGGGGAGATSDGPVKIGEVGSMTGTEYLQAKQAQIRRQQETETELRALAGEIGALVGETARAVREMVTPDQLAISWLVNRDRLSDYQQRLAAFLNEATWDYAYLAAVLERYGLTDKWKQWRKPE